MANPTAASVLKRLEAEEERRKAADAALLTTIQLEKEIRLDGEKVRSEVDGELDAQIAKLRDSLDRIDGEVGVLEERLDNLEAPAPTPSPSPDIFSGSKISDFPVFTEADDNRITDLVVPIPPAGSQTAIRFNVKDTDVYPLTPTENPRAELLTGDILKPGAEFWLSTSFWLDTPPFAGWMTLLSIYGEPYDGPAPWHIGCNGKDILWERPDGTAAWTVPFVQGKRYEVLHHHTLAVGGHVYTEINGTPVSSADVATITKANNAGDNHAKICHYRKKGMFGEGKVYFSGLRIGSTRESVS